MTLRFSGVRRRYREGPTPLFVLVWLFFGFSYLGCVSTDEEPQKPTPSTAKVEPPPVQQVEEKPSQETVTPLQEQTAPQIAKDPTEAPLSLEETAATPKSEPAAPGSIPAESKSAMPIEQEGITREEEPISPPSTLSTPIGTVTASRLNVRQGPDLTAAKVSTVPQGAKVQILGEEGDWYHITAHDGTLEGWVAKRFVDVTSAGALSGSSTGSSEPSST